MKHWVIVLAMGAGIAGCRADGVPPPSPTTPPMARANPSPNPRPAIPAQPAAAPVSTTQPSAPIARLGHIEIARDRLVEPLIEAYGLDYLLQLATLELAIATADKNGITLSDHAVDDEIKHFIANLFQEAQPEDYDNLLNQVLAQQNLSRQQFELVMHTNAWLRAMVEPLVEQRITDESLRQAFGALYGETVRIRHIQLANMQEVAIAQRRLALGEAFDKVAREQSRNAQTAPRGGELPPFSRQMQGLPESFKDAAFALQEGEVSDAVQSDGAYHLIKLEERIPPKAVEFDDHREIVREQLAESMTTQGIKQLRNQLAQEAIRTIDINHPALSRQFQERLRASSRLEEAERDQVLRDLELQRQRLEEQAPPTTAPASPAAAPATPTTAPAGNDPAAPAATTQPAHIEANK